MIIEIEDRFCKVAEVFTKVLDKLQRAAERGHAVHEVEEMTWGGLIEAGRQMVAAYQFQRSADKLREVPDLPSSPRWRHAFA